MWKSPAKNEEVNCEEINQLPEANSRNPTYAQMFFGAKIESKEPVHGVLNLKISTIELNIASGEYTYNNKLKKPKVKKHKNKHKKSSSVIKKVSTNLQIVENKKSDNSNTVNAAKGQESVGGAALLGTKSISRKALAINMIQDGNVTRYHQKDFINVTLRPQDKTFNTAKYDSKNQAENDFSKVSKACSVETVNNFKLFAVPVSAAGYTLKKSKSAKANKKKRESKKKLATKIKNDSQLFLQDSISPLDSLESLSGTELSSGISLKASDSELEIANSSTHTWVNEISVKGSHLDSTQISEDCNDENFIAQRYKITSQLVTELSFHEDAMEMCLKNYEKHATILRNHIARIEVEMEDQRLSSISFVPMTLHKDVSLDKRKLLAASVKPKCNFRDQFHRLHELNKIIDSNSDAISPETSITSQCIEH
eukprot:NODE_181_length_15774_cov_0.163892.p4 type:complete len:425 gc:universal NODE_181_length_15774_cov_0.163892:2977-4251(+)